MYKGSILEMYRVSIRRKKGSIAHELCGKPSKEEGFCRSGGFLQFLHLNLQPEIEGLNCLNP